MDYSFPLYLLSKQTVDDRALNKDVLNTLRDHLPSEPVSIIEVGAGIGTMLKRLVMWNLFRQGEYILVDSMQENITYAREWTPVWAAEAGLSVEWIGPDHLHLCDPTRDLDIGFECIDVFDFIKTNKKTADILVAHAFLDLLPMPESLKELLSLTKELAWLTINFDGLSSLLPVTDPILDEQIEGLYHATMDKRSLGGGSRTGRKLFEHLRTVEAEVLAAGASDWVVYGRDGKYAADEKYFLQFILHFFESSLKNCEDLETNKLQWWLERRRHQIDCGELVYIAHQMDFLARKKL
jgi:hypothetical protein